MTNPERLYAFTVRGAIYAGDTRAAVEASTALGWGASPVAEYVRADVAAEQTAAALRGEAHEVASLRAEVEALRGRVEKLRASVEDALSAYELTANGVAQAVVWGVQDALDADAAAAKGAW